VLICENKKFTGNCFVERVAKTIVIVSVTLFLSYANMQTKSKRCQNHSDLRSDGAKIIKPVPGPSGELQLRHC